MEDKVILPFFFLLVYEKWQTVLHPYSILPLIRPLPLLLLLPLPLPLKLPCQICIVFFALIFIFIDFSWHFFAVVARFLCHFVCWMLWKLFGIFAALLKLLCAVCLCVWARERECGCVCMCVYFRAKLYKCFLAASKRQHRKHHQQKRRQRRWRPNERLAQFAPLRGWLGAFIEQCEGWREECLRLERERRRERECKVGWLTVLDVLRTMWRMRNN